MNTVGQAWFWIAVASEEGPWAWCWIAVANERALGQLHYKRKNIGQESRGGIIHITPPLAGDPEPPWHR